jgi:hypothetical protein
MEKSLVFLFVCFSIYMMGTSHLRSYPSSKLVPWALQPLKPATRIGTGRSPLRLLTMSPIPRLYPHHHSFQLPTLLMLHLSCSRCCSLHAPCSLLSYPSVCRPGRLSFSLTKSKMSKENSGMMLHCSGCSICCTKGEIFCWGRSLGDFGGGEKYFSSMNTRIGHFLGYPTRMLVTLVERAVHHQSQALVCTKLETRTLVD